MTKQILNFFCGLRLTIICLAFGIVLVFVGTLAQVDMGIYAAQTKFFQSFIVYWDLPNSQIRIPVLPGGYLLGSLLMINLLCGHLQRFGLSKKKLGIFLIHIGLVLLLVGQLATDLLAKESHMRLTEGETKNYSESGRRVELAILETSNPDHDSVVAIPERVLEDKPVLRRPDLPFGVRIKSYYVNSEPSFRKTPPAAETQGVGAVLQFNPQPRTTRMDSRDIPAAEVELIGDKGSIGTWWVSSWTGEIGLLRAIARQAPEATRKALQAPQEIKVGDKVYQLTMRPERRYKPFSLTLMKFTHDRYMGTDIPKNFASRLKLNNPANGEEREVRIYMNNPLRYGGETFYQSGFDENDNRVTILQVVRNPGWLTPYLSCALVGIGLCLQFLMHLSGFLKRQKA